MDSDSSLDSSSPIILFDGVCNLCNSSVNFIIDHDPKQQFRFASLQSEVAQNILSQFKNTSHGLDSVVLWENDRIYFKSTAALKIAARLSGMWPLMNVFWIVPTVIRDNAYDFIAKNRYKWFGRQDACRMPSPELKNRFL